jgi:hypothetical protein
VAKSLFTHLEEEVASHYLHELRRVLRPGASALVTAFLIDEPSSSPSGQPKYNFAFGDHRVRWLMEHRPAAGIAFATEVFSKLCADAGLEISRIIAGYWRGQPGPAPNAQDLLILRRPSD